jgi:DNA-binding Xre family transcriptional regulator
MQGQTMVKSRLRLVVAQKNVERVKAGLPELTQRKIAEESSVPLSVIYGLISGRASRVDFKTLDRLCSYLEVMPGDLLEYTPNSQED